MPEHPLKAVGKGLAKDISLIVGTNQDEAKLYTAMRPPEKGFDETGLLKSIHRIIRIFGKDETHAKQLIETYIEEPGKAIFQPIH